ncbi:CopG family transcriptional regulator [Magnetospirillum fulvum]|uniref:Ribbon-helix-helix protein CopG domain-containing protein n=1 Tax=Magnetospirillum fulvum TaxID=1082 RepID=A0A1H6I0C0_MAGFU|nr:CopG family transcriptional regulator [Magnetospirillum fulvum]SEH41881.1 hypothetical protein SAMN04244559_02236 [Magnetospirillum fulvum]
MNRTRIRHQLFLDPDLSARLETLAAKPGVSKSTILADALAAWLNRRGSQELDERFGLRLHRISDQLDRIERDGQVLLESLALFVRYQLTAAAPCCAPRWDRRSPPPWPIRSIPLTRYVFSDSSRHRRTLMTSNR